MIQFKQYATINAITGAIEPNEAGILLQKIARFLHQANPRNIPSLYVNHINSNGSICWGMLFPDGDKIPCSDYINDEIFNKIVHYNEYEFKWKDGRPVLREVPLAGRILYVREEKATAHKSIYDNPTSLVVLHYKRIQEVFGVDLDTFVLE